MRKEFWEDMHERWTAKCADDKEPSEDEPSDWSEEWEDPYWEEDDEYYTPSATAGDYSPSCPWNAPGMKVSDFI